MNNETRMERNLSQGIRITEIPPNGEFEVIRCPFCNYPLQMGVVRNGKLYGATAYCKRCKRRLRIDKEK